MSTLTVLLPPRDVNLAPQDWRLAPLRFILADRRGAVLRAGSAPVELLPKAGSTTLILAARDVLLVDAVVPPLSGPRLKTALPNIIEDQILQDGPPAHIALGPAGASRKTAARRTLAVVDRGWFRFLHEAFTTAGHRNLRMVPLPACLPLTAEEPVLVAPPAASAASPSLAGANGGAEAPREPLATTPGASDNEADAEAKLALDAAAAAELAQAQALAASATVLIVANHGPQGAEQELVDSLAELGGDSGVAPRPMARTAAGADAGPGAGPRGGDPFGHQQVEVAIRRLPVPPLASNVPLARRYAGEGIVVPLDALSSTLSAVLPGVAAATHESIPTLRGRALFRLTEDKAAAFDSRLPDAGGLRGSGSIAGVFPGTLGANGSGNSRDDALDVALRQAGVAAQPIAFETIAAAAREVDFDLCQFEFENTPWRLRPGTLRQSRLPIALLAATIVVAVIGLNIEWLQLARQRDDVQARMTTTLLDAFPRTTVVLDPATQMRRSLDALRVNAGELAPDDFLSLANGLSASMGAIPPTAIAALDYDRRSLTLTFSPDAKIDSAFKSRLDSNGLDGSYDGKRWAIRSKR